MRQLVQDGDPDLLLEPLRISELPDERPPKDRDLVREVLVRLPEAEEVRIVRILVLDDNGDVLECCREVRRELVQGGPDVVIEGGAHQRGLSGARTWNSFTARTPKTNPPTCAANATPPP